MGSSLDPVDLDNITVQDVAAGQSHTCVVLTSGDVACWGYNYYGQVKSNRCRWSVKKGLFCWVCDLRPVLVVVGRSKRVYKGD